MIELSAPQWQQWLNQTWWCFARVGACLMVAPMFGAHTVPRRIRLSLALAITVLIAPLVTFPAGIELFSGSGLVVTAQQMLVGVAMGFAMQIVFDAVATGGQLLANSIGLSFAINIDPLHGSSTPVLGQLYLILTTLVFLSLNGHLLIIESLTQSFTLLPVGTAMSHEGLWVLVLFGGTLFSGALMVALPGMIAALLVNLAFGVMSRAAPAMNLFGVGFPAILAFGLIIVLLSLPNVQTQFVHLLSGLWQVINHIITPVGMTMTVAH